jgi:hypothetical protein
LNKSSPPPVRSKRRQFIFRAANLFQGTANGLLIALIIIFGASAVLSSYHVLKRQLFPLPPLNAKLLAPVHPHLSISQIDKMLNETYFERPFEYAPFTGFRERPRTGSFVSVSTEGFRFGSDKKQTLRTPHKKVCLFGGSTVFGYGVDDHNTIAAHLQRLLDSQKGGTYSVFNFGRGFYYSGQESALFQQLILQGVRCHIAIFIDGLNETQSIPHFTERLYALFANYNYAPTRFLLSSLERTVFISDMARLLRPPPRVRQLDIRDYVSAYARSQLVDIQLGRVTGTKVLFVIQPVPGYRNRFAQHKYQSTGCPEGSPCTPPDTRRLRLMSKLADGQTTFDFTGIFEKDHALPFLDDVHYTTAANLQIARSLKLLVSPPTN